MTKRRIRWQYSFRVLLATCLVGGVLTFCFAERIRQSIESIYDPVSGPEFRVTHTSGATQAWDSWADMHEYYEDQFVNGEGFGLRRVVSFDEPDYRPIEINGQLYTVQALELISLEKHDHPVAYVNTIGYPVRKHYKQSKTRELHPFEQDALKKIRKRSDAVYNGKPSEPVFVGAIRARKSCVQCHENAQVGDLLGAFAYRFAPQQPPRVNLPVPSAVTQEALPGLPDKASS